ncbi:hypothetical protein [Salinivibrio costicola]|uniref:hypothetical protein n=1 Tax=Salinivibrio costicola TaxID=51367 RepID=UPI000471D3E8|nr:hypothetical protein [Salinivibrio costicola]
MKRLLSGLFKGLGCLIHWLALNLYALVVVMLMLAYQIAMAILGYLVRRYLRLAVITGIMLLIIGSR